MQDPKFLHLDESCVYYLDSLCPYFNRGNSDVFPVSAVTANLDPDSTSHQIVWVFSFPQDTDTKSMGRGPVRGGLEDACPKVSVSFVLGSCPLLQKIGSGSQIGSDQG